MSNLQMHFVNSGHIEALSYDPDNQTMFVAYRSGAEYAYNHISYDTFMSILEAPSVGAAVNSCGVKGQRC